nr:MAG TPA: hypothetical protein [Caudoviricetes sp.]
MIFLYFLSVFSKKYLTTLIGVGQNGFTMRY